MTVIDYKTSRPPGGWKPDPFTGGELRLQLPIYGLAAHEHLGRPEAEIAAEYWHLGDRVKERKRLTVDVGERTPARGCPPFWPTSPTPSPPDSSCPIPTSRTPGAGRRL